VLAVAACDITGELPRSPDVKTRFAAPTFRIERAGDSWHVGSEDEREWLERVACATEHALSELRAHEYPSLGVLIDDLEAFRRELGRRLTRATGDPGLP
jgi:hypothetical protein